MRKLQVSKRFGTVYDETSFPGDLTIFCPSCPQPGINLPPNWQSLPNWITRRTIAVDGNFHADHIKMRRPDLDVMLTNGRGYMVEEERYKEYLSVAKEPRLVSKWKILSFYYILTYISRGHPVGITELSTPPTRIIAATLTRLASLPAAAQDMDALSRPQSVTCKRENGGCHFDISDQRHFQLSCLLQTSERRLFSLQCFEFQN
jgi:hypothetical protein